MTFDLPTLNAIEKLSDAELESIKAAYHEARKHVLWRSGTAALAEVYGLLLDDEGLELLEDAVRARTAELPVMLAVRWAYLAFKDHATLSKEQKAFLGKPWQARHA